MYMYLCMYNFHRYTSLEAVDADGKTGNHVSGELIPLRYWFFHELISLLTHINEVAINEAKLR